MAVHGKQVEAREARAAREDRARFRNGMREKLRLRGAELKERQQAQKRTNDDVRAGLRRAHVAAGEARRTQHEEERSQRQEAQRVHEEHGHVLGQLEREQEARTREAVEEVRRRREVETANMRAELKEQKQLVDLSNLQLKRELVELVRADTAPEKIRHAKATFIYRRRDQAGALRDQLEQFKMQRQERERTFMSEAHALNQAVAKEAEQPKRVKAKARAAAAAEAAELRRQREELREKDEENRRTREEAAKAVHASMQGPKVLIGEELGETLGHLFARMFGLAGHHTSTPSHSQQTSSVKI